MDNLHEYLNKKKQTIEASLNNVNGTSKDFPSNTSKQPFKPTPEYVRNKAQYPCDKFNRPNNFPLYCKFCWKIPEQLIDKNVEASFYKNAKEPSAIFYTLCNDQMPKD